MEIELKLTKKELEYIYFAIENYTPLDGIENLPVEEKNIIRTLEKLS